MIIPMKLTATWINAVGDKREVDARQRLYCHELLRQVESVEALHCMHNQAVNYPNTHHRYWAITAAALVRTFGDKPNRDGSVFCNIMKLNFNMGNE